MLVNTSPLPNPAFWAGKRVLLTGHTGFKGAWLALWLQRLGAQVSGLALTPPAQPALFTLAGVEHGMAASHMGDIRNAAETARVVRASQPQVVLHLAAQALVRPSYTAPLDTLATNIMGTAHVLDALRGLDCVRAVVVVTTDKVYRNREWAYPYRESDALGGHDPYSASKAACELVAASYRDAFLQAQGVALATARAGNVVGGGDWAVDRLIPDAVRAWESGKPLEIRSPASTRPWQHVLEPLAAYLRLAEALYQGSATASAYNFGPLPHEAASVHHVIEMARKAYPNGIVSYQNESGGPHEAGWLALETAHARQQLSIAPRWSLEHTINRTMHWYQALHAGSAARDLCSADLDAYAQEPSTPAGPSQ